MNYIIFHLHPWGSFAKKNDLLDIWNPRPSYAENGVNIFFHKFEPFQPYLKLLRLVLY